MAICEQVQEAVSYVSCRAMHADEILELSRGYQPAAVLAAAAELDVFSILGTDEQSAASLADKLGADRRGMTCLLDALAAWSLIASRTTSPGFTMNASSPNQRAKTAIGPVSLDIVPPS